MGIFGPSAAERVRLMEEEAKDREEWNKCMAEEEKMQEEWNRKRAESAKQEQAEREERLAEKVAEKVILTMIDFGVFEDKEKTDEN